MKLAKVLATLTMPALLAPAFVHAQPSTNAQLLLTVQQLQDEMRYLRGEVEKQAYKIRQLEQAQQENYRDLDKRVSDLLQSGKPVSSGSEVPAGAAVQEGDQQAYQQAMNLVRARKFDETLAAFEQFVGQYPQSPLVANAYYWMGEIYLAKGRFEPAREVFARVVNQFPKHQKRADATYKLAVAYHKLGDKAQAQKYLSSVQSQYPQSSAAQLARDYSL